MEPKVENIITANILRSVYLQIKPEKVRITSDGIGGNIFSIAISKNIPKYPYLTIIACILSPNNIMTK